MSDLIDDLIDDLIESARLLGATQMKKGFGCYTREDARFERAMRESISDKAKRLTAERDELRRQLADGFGRQSWLGETGGYGNGSICVHDINGVRPAEES